MPTMIQCLIFQFGTAIVRFEFTEEIARNAVGSGIARVLDDIDLALVVAHVGAMYARDTVLKRDRWGPIDVEEKEEVHDEL